MKASIIITTYNRPEFLKRAILSCISQKTSYKFEIIVADDNGINTAAQIETAAVVSKYDDIKYLPLEKNSGACIARNEGSEMAVGEYLFFLDDDDEYLQDKLQIQIDFLENNKDYDGSLAAFKRLDEKGSEILSATNFPVAGDFKKFVLEGNFFTPMICIRKKSFIKSGGFIDIPRFQDRFYMMSMLKQDFKFGVLPVQLHVMYEHSADRITSKSLEKTKNALSQIMNWLNTYKPLFTNQEWEKIEIDSLKKVAISYYNSSSKKERRKATKLYWDIFRKTFVFSDFILMIKSLVK